MKIAIQCALATLALAACGRTAPSGPLLDAVSPTSALNDRAVTIEVTGRDIAEPGGPMPSVFLDDLPLQLLGADSTSTVRAVVPPQLAPGRRDVRLLTPGGEPSVGEVIFFVLAGQ